MTIAGIILFGILTLFIIFISICIVVNFDSKKATAITAVVSTILIIVMWFGGIWYYTSTESGKRAVKSQDSNFHGGIEREVIVYDMDGDEIERFRGRFDVDYSDERIMFDDENGNRHVIYFKSGTVIVNEIGGEEECGR